MKVGTFLLITSSLPARQPITVWGCAVHVHPWFNLKLAETGPHNRPLNLRFGGNPPRFLLDAYASGLDMGKAIKGANMLYYALIFLLVAALAGALGFVALAGVAALIAKMMFILFLLLFIIALTQRGRL